MSFQAYIDTIKAKTGLDPADFKKIAQEKGLLDGDAKAGPIIAWLAEDYGLGRGHGMALVATFKPKTKSDSPVDDAVAKQFSGPREHWRATWDALLAKVEEFGPVKIMPTSTYLSLVKGTGKFAIVSATGDRFDVGIKLKGVDPEGRYEAAGSWNSMVTHRVRLAAPVELDDDLLAWLRRAYDAA